MASRCRVDRCDSFNTDAVKEIIERLMDEGWDIIRFDLVPTASYTTYNYQPAHATYPVPPATLMNKNETHGHQYVIISVKHD